jgi:hypothetical protein
VAGWLSDNAKGVKMASRRRQVNREPQPSAAKSPTVSKGGRIIEMEEAQAQRRNKRSEDLRDSKLKQREGKVQERRKKKLIEKKERRDRKSTRLNSSHCT